MILVTGGTGLVGAHLLLYLVENDTKKLRAIYRKSKQIEKTKSLFSINFAICEVCHLTDS